MGDCYIVRKGSGVSRNNGFPEFEYSGQYNLVDDGLAEDGKTQNWRIKLLTSGKLTFAKLGSGTDGIDVFCVGGGGPGSYTTETSNNWGHDGGGGGGYTTTQKKVMAEAKKEYEIVVGAGGKVTEDTAVTGGTSSAFGVKADGGKCKTWGNGGDGGSGGGNYENTQGGTNGGNGGAASGNYAQGKGQGTTTKEFGESDGTLYSTGGTARAGGGGSKGANTGDGGNSRDYYDGKAQSQNGGSGIVVIRNAR